MVTSDTTTDPNVTLTTSNGTGLLLDIFDTNNGVTPSALSGQTEFFAVTGGTGGWTSGAGYEIGTFGASETQVWDHDQNSEWAMSGAYFAAVPEPSTLALLGIALGSVVLLRRRRS